MHLAHTHAAYQCDSTCSCGFCGGPGQCVAAATQCPSKSIAWVAAPVIVGIFVFVLVVLIVYGCKKDKLACECFVTLDKPPPSKVHPLEFIDLEPEAVVPVQAYDTTAPQRASFANNQQRASFAQQQRTSFTQQQQQQQQQVGFVRPELRKSNC